MTPIAVNGLVLANK